MKPAQHLFRIFRPFSSPSSAAQAARFAGLNPSSAFSATLLLGYRSIPSLRNGLYPQVRPNGVRIWRRVSAAPGW